MAPRRSPRAHTGVIVGTPLDSSESEIAGGIYLPFTRVEVQAANIAGLEGLTVTFTVMIRDRMPVCESITVMADEGNEVTSSSLRGIPLAALTARAFEGLGFPYRREGDVRIDVRQSEVTEAREVKHRPRSQVLPEIVAAYRAALADPMKRSAPTQAVADELHYARGYVSRMLSDARKEGLLGPASPGRSGESSQPRASP